MHSLALRILHSANLLAVLYPHDPSVLVYGPVPTWKVTPFTRTWAQAMGAPELPRDSEHYWGYSNQRQIQQWALTTLGVT